MSCFDLFRIDNPLIKLHDISLVINQEGSRQTHVAVSIEQIAIENVVDAGDVIRAAKNGKRTVKRLCSRRCRFSGSGVDIDG